VRRHGVGLPGTVVSRAGRSGYSLGAFGPEVRNGGTYFDHGAIYYGRLRSTSRSAAHAGQTKDWSAKAE